MEVLIQQALDEIEKYRIEIPLKPYSPVDFTLPNCWYITSYKHLYNSMGPRGHKEANLQYPYDYTILRDRENPLPQPYLKSIQKIKERGFITNAEYDSYLNLIYDFPCIYPESFYDLDLLSKVTYNSMDKKSYSPSLVNLIIGIESAHASLYDFFYQLRCYSNNYERNLDILSHMEFDDVLVRCCGFHKVSSEFDKVITTSCINYEEEFREYIEKGWKIDFVPPIIINQDIGMMEDYPEEFLIIRKVLKNQIK